MEISLTDLKDIAEEAGLDEDAIYEDYSGRGMYGKTCVGFTTRDNGTSAILHLGAAVMAVLGPDHGTDMLNRATTDSMGLGTIIYFPGITLLAE